MAFVAVPVSEMRLRGLCLQADVATLDIPDESVGDWVKVLDGADVIWDGSAWVDEADESTGAVTISSLPSVGFSVKTVITRPANTTPYTAGDVVGGALDLGVLGASASVIEIISSQLEADIASIPASQTTFTLYLYNVTPPSALADNAVFDLPSGDRASFLGAIPIAALADLGSTLYSESNGHNKIVKLAGTHLFGYLVTTVGFTPAGNSEVYNLTLGTVGR